MKLKRYMQLNEKGSLVENLMVILFAVLATGALALVIYNAISDRSEKMVTGIRDSSSAAAFDLDGDGTPNGLILVGISSTGIKYWRVVNPAVDYGLSPSVSLDLDDDGDTKLNSSEITPVLASDPTDNYFGPNGLGATHKTLGTQDPHNPTR